MIYFTKKSPNNFESYFTYSSNILAYSTRQKSANHLFLLRFHTSKTQRSIKYLGSKIRNSIFYDIRILPFTKFKSSFKFHLLSKYVLDYNFIVVDLWILFFFFFELVFFSLRDILILNYGQFYHT